MTLQISGCNWVFGEEVSIYIDEKLVPTKFAGVIQEPGQLMYVFRLGDGRLFTKPTTAFDTTGKSHKLSTAGKH